MAEQSYASHRRFVPLYHYVLFGLVVLTLVAAGYQVFRAWDQGEGRALSVLVLSLSVIAALLFYFARIFALKAQDRAIRAEESLRCYVLTGKLPDNRLSARQFIGLRFASDEELPELARRAAEEGLSQDAIKRAIKSWRPDHYRV